VGKVCDEQRRKHEQVRDRLINGLSIHHPCRRRRFVLRHGQLHEPGEEEGREQQHVHLQGHHLPYTLVGAERMINLQGAMLAWNDRQNEWRMF